MQKLTPFQLSLIYLALFTIGESDFTEEQEKQLIGPLDEVLTQHDEPTNDIVIFDNEGGPLTASDEVNKAYWDFIGGSEDVVGGNFIGEVLSFKLLTPEDVIKSLTNEQP